MKRTTTSLPVFSGVVIALAAAVSWSACDGGSKTAGTNEEPTPCRLNSECDRAYVCSDGLCLPECQEDRDCTGDEVCWWPDYGCLPPGEEPPQATPPRDVEFDPDAGLDVTFDGCELDSDCRVGETCDSGECSSAAGANCEWGPESTVQRVLLMKMAAGPTALARQQREHVACSLSTALDASETSRVFVFEYGGGTFTSVAADRPAIGPSDTASCAGVQKLVDGYFVAIRVNRDALGTNLSPSGTVVSEHTVASGEAGLSGTLFTSMRVGSGGLLYLAWEAGGTSTIKSGLPTTDWSTALSRAGTGPTAVGDTTATIAAVHEIDGVIERTAGGGTPYTIAADHRTVDLHRRADGDIGWFSVDDAGNLYYSTGQPGSSWSTDATGVVDPDSFSVPALPEPGDPYPQGYLPYVRSDVATEMESGEPLLVYLTKRNTIALVAHKGDVWIAWESPVPGGGGLVFDFKANWTGCGRPAAELVITASAEAGWHLLEVH